MSSKPEIASFLKDFKEKMRFWDVLFRDERGKNTQALLDLEFRPVDRNTVLQALEVNNFSKGPVKEELNRGAVMWVFGKTIKKREVYIGNKEILAVYLKRFLPNLFWKIIQKQKAT